MADILNTETSIIKDLYGNPKAKITRLSGGVGVSEIILYFTLEAFRKFPINLIPKLKIEFIVDKRLNMLSFTTSKDISPLKKGETVVFHFEDNTYFQQKFNFGRSQYGNEVKNYLFITDLELWHLTQVRLSHILMNSALERTYDFINIPNAQYSNEIEGGGQG